MLMTAASRTSPSQSAGRPWKPRFPRLSADFKSPKRQDQDLWIEFSANLSGNARRSCGKDSRHTRPDAPPASRGLRSTRDKPGHREGTNNATSLWLLMTCLLSLVDSPALAKPPRVHGRVTFRGEIPKSKTPDGEGIRQPVLQVNAKNHGLADAVVFLQSLDAKADENRPPRKSPKDKDTAPEKDERPAVVIDQKGYRFRPHLVVDSDFKVPRKTNPNPAWHHSNGALASPFWASSIPLAIARSFGENGVIRSSPQPDPCGKV